MEYQLWFSYQPFFIMHERDAGSTYHQFNAKNDAEAKKMAGKLWEEIRLTYADNKRSVNGPYLVEKPRHIEWDPRR